MNDSSKKPATATSTWTRHQLESLQALGIPLYTFIQPTQPTAEFNDQAPRSNVEFHYRLGPWTLRVGERLPVGLYPWLKDLSNYLQQPLTEVKADTEQPHLDITPWCKATLSPEEKRDLWNQLKPWLN